MTLPSNGIILDLYTVLIHIYDLVLICDSWTLFMGRFFVFLWVGGVEQGKSKWILIVATLRRIR